MSRLYIRVMTGFYTHRKTLRLKSRIGNDAYWLPPRLWAYCAENQPDGNLQDYTAEEIAELVAYKGDAQALLVALKDCGFMDLEGGVHGWSEHNGFHSIFSQRAKTAAEARWGKERKNQRKSTVPEKEREREASICASNATSIARFRPPTLDQMKLHGAKIGLSEAEVLKCHAHYESNGWRVGRNPMKSWPMVMVKWKLNAKEYSHGNGKNIGSNHAFNPAADRRNAGTIGGTDYGEAGRRKLARQEADRLAKVAAQNGTAPSPVACHG